MNSTTDLPEPVQPPGSTGAPVYITNNIYNTPPAAAAPDRSARPWEGWRAVVLGAAIVLVVGVAIGLAMAGTPVTFTFPVSLT